MGLKPRPSLARPTTAAGPIASFAAIYDRALRRKGGQSALESLLPSPKTRSALVKMDDARYLSAIARNIFRAGFVWKVVDNKWPGFEAAFAQFDVLRVAGMDEEDIDELAADSRIIRNRQKISAVRDNARFVFAVVQEHGSFGAYLADWPHEDLLGLWDDLHRRGSRLGGFTRAVFLREVGKDTFMLSSDVVRALVGAGIIARAASSQRDLRAVQAAFNVWHLETGRPLCQLSRILACSVD